MICTKCYAEYLDNVKVCGECNIPLADACLIDMPIPIMDWKSLPPFEGKIYAEMAAEVLEEHSIPYYLKLNWVTSTFNITGTTQPNEIIRIFVPEDYLDSALELSSSISGIDI